MGRKKKVKSLERAPSREELAVIENVADHVLYTATIFGQYEIEDLRQELIIAGLESYQSWNGGDGTVKSGRSLRMWTLEAATYRLRRIFDQSDRGCRKIHRYLMASVEELGNPESTNPSVAIPVELPDTEHKIRSTKKYYVDLPSPSYEESIDLDFPDDLSLTEDQRWVVWSILTEGLSDNPLIVWRALKKRTVDNKEDPDRNHEIKMAARKLDISWEHFQRAWDELEQNQLFREYLEVA